MGKRSNLPSDKPKGNAFKHGHRLSQQGGPSRTYRCWCSMVERGKRNENYPEGTTLTCDKRWLDFRNFLHDMGEAPSELHTLDRIDNSSGYVKGNVRWATMHEQNRNKRSNIWVEGQILKDWCDSRGYRYKTVWQWFKNGLTLDEIKSKGDSLWVKEV